MKSCQLSSRKFFQWISDWELAPSLALASFSVALPWGPSYVPRNSPIHWNLELTEPHLSQCIFGRTPNVWSSRSSGWNDKCLGFCHMTMKVTSDSAPFTAEVGNAWIISQRIVVQHFAGNIAEGKLRFVIIIDPKNNIINKTTTTTSSTTTTNSSNDTLL